MSVSVWKKEIVYDLTHKEIFILGRILSCCVTWEKQLCLYISWQLWNNSTSKVTGFEFQNELQAGSRALMFLKLSQATEK